VDQIMTLILARRAPLAALRTAVFGFLGGTCLGTLFVAAVFVFDIGNVATLAHADGFPLGDLGLLPLTFGLIGLVAAPALGSATGDVAD
jgi:hypothetical protein